MESWISILLIGTHIFQTNSSRLQSRTPLFMNQGCKIQELCSFCTFQIQEDLSTFFQIVQFTICKFSKEMSVTKIEQSRDFNNKGGCKRASKWRVED